MENQLDIVVDLVAALAAALAGGWLAARFRLSPVFGYVVAGLVISPFTPGFVGDTDRVRLLGDIGVVILLFGIGTQFSTRELLESGRNVGALAGLQVAATIGLGFAVGRAFGWGSLQALFFGAAVSLSSTTVMTKILTERSEVSSRHGRIAITWALVQDLTTVVLVMLLGLAAKSGVEPGHLALSGLKITAFLILVLVIGPRVVPWVLDRVLAVHSREVFVLAIATLALGTAAAAAALEVSLALGAFLAGLVVAASGRAQLVLEEMLPVRDILAVLFFVTVGMLIDPAEVAGDLHVFAATLALIVVAKFLFIAPPLLLAGVPYRTALLSGLLLAQSAEFSFILLDAGVDKGVLSEHMFSLIVAAVGVSVLLTPALTALLPSAAQEEHASTAVPA